MSALRTKREQEGLSLEEAAAQVGCNKATLSRIETGKQQPRPALARALRQRFKLTDAELVDMFTTPEATRHGAKAAP